MTEEAPRLPPERATEEIMMDTYGPLKVAAEDDCRRPVRRPGPPSCARGVVAGPHDGVTGSPGGYAGRPEAAGVALPARPDQPVQVIDSRDLASLVVRLLVDDRAGAYNAVGPEEPLTFAELIHTCAAAAGPEVEVVTRTAGFG